MSALGSPGEEPRLQVFLEYVTQGLTINCLQCARSKRLVQRYRERLFLPVGTDSAKLCVASLDANYAEFKGGKYFQYIAAGKLL